jgi:RecA-family ATPase
MRPGAEQPYLIDELIPKEGIVVIWGKPKCLKSFVTLDMMLHVAMGWEYRDRAVRQGTVIYLCL